MRSAAAPLVPFFADETWLTDGILPSGDRFRCWVVFYGWRQVCSCSM